MKTFAVISLLWICGYVATLSFTWDKIKKEISESNETGDAKKIFTIEFLMALIGIMMIIFWPLEAFSRIRKNKR